MEDIKTVIVTGAAGFIGCNLVRALNERGYTNLIVTDSLDNGEKWKNLRKLQFEDYWDRDYLLKQLEADQLENIAAILHMGACSATTELDSAYLMENNYRYTRKLASWCIDHKVRFITASSAATYGDGRSGYSDNDAVIDSYLPLNMYGFSKHLFDKWALRHGYYEQIVGLKFFNVYGPHEDHKQSMMSLVRKAFNQVNERGYIELFKSARPEYRDGEQVRDFVYVNDVVKVILFFLEHPAVNGLFNCGTGVPRTWNDLATAVFMAMERPVDIRYIDMPDSLKKMYQYYTCADTEKLRAAGYDSPFTSLEEGVKDYVKSYLEKI